MFNRLGIRGHLLIAFLTISAFALIASLTAFYSILSIGQSVEQITRKSVPSALASLELSRRVEKILSVAPELLSAKNQEQYQTTSSKISATTKELRRGIENSRRSGFPKDMLPQIEATTDEFIENLQQLEKIVFQKIEAHRQKSRLLAEFEATHLAARRLLTPGIRVLDSGMSTLSKLSNNENTRQNVTDGASIARLYPLQKARFEIFLIHNTLLKAAGAEKYDLAILSHPLQRSLRSLEKLTRQMDLSVKMRMQKRTSEYGHFINGSKSILVARQTELEFIDRGKALLTANGKLSDTLTTLVRGLVTRANLAMQTSNKNALTTRNWSTGILIAIVMLSFASSLVIVWLYVHGFLGKRLTAIIASMRDIADGNLDVAIPADGFDEIGQMAKALTVFRDTAREVQRTNLREITEARHRLTDAIESLSAGFVLFDRANKLVICNEYYRGTLYGPASKAIRTGSAYKDIIAAISAFGILEKDMGNEDDSSASSHYRPADGRTYLRKFQDGRQILISSRKTEDGGTVEVHSDITELKTREHDLVEKSRQLHHLSQQLAKYLPPQIYELILQTDQNVHIASIRKKLSVFFSDIAGFTETADRLESEELTALINEYLTEMSKIAHEFGGTIDKFMGDGIMIFFGDPESRGAKEDALACVRMAIAMQEKLRSLAVSWRRAGIENPLLVRMGVHTDYCTVGNFGSEERMDYTIIGSGANTASRLETAATPGEILISYETYSQVRDQIDCKKVGSIDVKGMAYPVSTYQVVAEHSENSDAGQKYHMDSPNLTIELNASDMDKAELEQAGRSLQKALQVLSVRKWERQ